MVFDAFHKLPQESQQFLETVFSFLKGRTPACNHALNQAILTLIRCFLCKYFFDPCNCFWISDARDITAQQSSACTYVIEVLDLRQIHVLFEESFVVSSVEVLLKDVRQVYRVSRSFLRA